MSFVGDFASDLFGGSKPDTGGINEAAVQSAALGNRAFDWYAQEYARTAPQRDQAVADASAVTKAQLESMGLQNEIARDYNEYNKNTFRPLEASMIEAAKGYDTPERRAQAAAEAVAGVNSQVAAQREATAMDLARSGVSPESAKSRSMMASGDINAARMSAGAAAGARRNVEATGHARMADAANLGRNLPSAQATAMQTGINAGNSAVNSSGVGVAAGQSGAGLMGAGFNTAMGGLGQMGGMFTNAAGIQSQTRGQNLDFQASMYSSTMNGMSSMFGSAMSDEKVKKGTGKKADTASMLEAVMNTPVDEGWSYDPKKGGPDDGGMPHDGPMAQDVNKHMGEKAAPGGKMIDLVTMNGVSMGAIQELGKRVKKLEQRKAA